MRGKIKGPKPFRVLRGSLLVGQNSGSEDNKGKNTNTFRAARFFLQEGKNTHKKGF